MKFFKDPKNWKQEISSVFLTVGIVLFLLSFFVLGTPNALLLINCVMLLVPLILGSFWKMKLPAIIILLLSFAILWQEKTAYMPVRKVSPSGNVVFINPKGYNNCYKVRIGNQLFQTRASIFHNIYTSWKNDDCFVLDSSDVGIIEFRKENDCWVTSPNELSEEVFPEGEVVAHESK